MLAGRRTKQKLKHRWYIRSTRTRQHHIYQENEMIVMFAIVIGVCVLLPEVLLHAQKERRKEGIPDIQK